MDAVLNEITKRRETIRNNRRFSEERLVEVLAEADGFVADIAAANTLEAEYDVLIGLVPTPAFRNLEDDE